MLILMILPTLSLPAEDSDNVLPPLTIPEPPAEQEGDDEIVQTTVGAMRNALYYYRLTPLLIEYARDANAIALEKAQMVDVERALKDEALRESARWRKRTFIAGGLAALFLSASLVMLVW